MTNDEIRMTNYRRYPSLVIRAWSLVIHPDLF